MSIEQRQIINILKCQKIHEEMRLTEGEMHVTKAGCPIFLRPLYIHVSKL